jgi:hypothetical protein
MCFMMIENVQLKLNITQNLRHLFKICSGMALRQSSLEASTRPKYQEMLRQRCDVEREAGHKCHITAYITRAGSF